MSVTEYKIKERISQLQRIITSSHKAVGHMKVIYNSGDDVNFHREIEAKGHLDNLKSILEISSEDWIDEMILDYYDAVRWLRSQR